VPLSIVQANLWRENPSKPEDVALLASTKADILNVNEARLFEPLLKKVPGYQTIQPGTGFMLNNAILVRDGIKVTGFEARRMCDPVNDVAARSATLVKFEFAGKQRAHLCTHMNAHIQLTQNEPQSLPRVKEAIRHAIRLEAWNADDKNDWTYSPEAITTRLGMRTNADEPGAPGPTLGKRTIDYLWFDPMDLRVATQEYVRGEHSDHSWVRVDFVTG
jgi:hypothetical protein